jgi:thiosulfate/3-mercaptopyruvate sulfurtransferase
MLLNEDKTFKSIDALLESFKSVGLSDPATQPMILSCQRGVTACILDAAMRLVGNENTSVYDGSYEEYSKML